jgi:hypothetical protein
MKTPQKQKQKKTSAARPIEQPPVAAAPTAQDVPTSKVYWLKHQVLTKHGVQGECWAIDTRTLNTDAKYVIGVLRLFVNLPSLLQGFAPLDAVTFRFGFDEKTPPTLQNILLALCSGDAASNSYDADLGVVAFQGAEPMCTTLAAAPAQPGAALEATPNPEPVVAQ